MWPRKQTGWWSWRQEPSFSKVFLVLASCLVLHDNNNIVVTPYSGGCMRQLLKINKTLREKNYKKVIHFGFLFLFLWRVLPCGFVLLLVLLLCADPQLSGLLDECLFALAEFVRFHLIDHAEVLQVIHNLIHRDRLNAKPEQNRTSAS